MNDVKSSPVRVVPPARVNFTAQESEDRGAVPTVASELAGSALFVVASAQKENGVPREGAQGYKTGLARRGDIDA